jgi:hypothetical protein
MVAGKSFERFRSGRKGRNDLIAFLAAQSHWIGREGPWSNQSVDNASRAKQPKGEDPFADILHWKICRYFGVADRAATEIAQRGSLV